MSEHASSRGERSMAEEEALSRMALLGVQSPVYSQGSETVRELFYKLRDDLPLALAALMRRFPGHTYVYDSDMSVLPSMPPDGLLPYDRWMSRDDEQLRVVTELATGRSRVIAESLPGSSRLSVWQVNPRTTQLTVAHELSVNNQREIDCRIASAGVSFYMAEDGLFWLRDGQGPAFIDPARLLKPQQEVWMNYPALGILQYEAHQTAGHLVAAAGLARPD